MNPGLQPSATFLRETRRLVGKARGRRVGLGVLRRPQSVVPILAAMVLVVVPAATSSWAPQVANAFDVLVIVWVMLAASSQDMIGEHPHHLPFAFWPADEDAAVRRLLRRALLRWTRPCALLGMGHAIGALRMESPPHPALAVLQGVLFALLLAGVAVVQSWAALRWRPFRRYLSAIAWCGLAIAGAAVSDTLRRPVASMLPQHGDLLAAMVPPGWLVLPWSAWVRGGPWLNASFAIPLAVVLAALPRVLQELRAFGRFRDRILFEWFGQIPEDAPAELGDALHAALTSMQSANAPGPTATTDAILAQSFLGSPLASPGRLLDRWAWRWWTPAQRLAAECMMRSWPLARTHRTVGLLAIPAAWAATWFCAHRQFEGPSVILPVVLHGVVVATLVPWLSPFSGIAVVRALPIRLLDVAWLRWKHTLLRALLPSAFLPAAGAVSMWIAEQPAWMGAIVGLQVAWAPVVVSPFATVYGLLNGTHAKGLVGRSIMVVVALLVLFNITGAVVLWLPFIGLGFETLCLALNLALLLTVNRLLHRIRI